MDPHEPSEFDGRQVTPVDQLVVHSPTTPLYLCNLRDCQKNPVRAVTSPAVVAPPSVRLVQGCSLVSLASKKCLVR